MRRFLLLVVAVIAVGGVGPGSSLAQISTAPDAADSTTVPQTIVEGLRADGIDVSGSRLVAVKESDVTTSQRVVTIGATLPAEVQKAAGEKIEQWNDVPPPSDGFAMTRDLFKAHVHQLIEKLDKH